jgi:hypothetical protein
VKFAAAEVQELIRINESSNVKNSDLAELSCDELWHLRGKIRLILSKRLSAEIKRHELRLVSLNKLIGNKRKVQQKKGI